jgi:hypothetical protein
MIESRVRSLLGEGSEKSGMVTENQGRFRDTREDSKEAGKVQ